MFSMFPPPQPIGSPVGSKRRGAPDQPGDGSYDSTITSFEAETEAALAATDIDVSPVDEALACSQPQWDQLRALLSDDPCMDTAHEEAGRKLVLNHAAVLRDITNPTPVSQLQLVRVPEEHAQHVDQALREVARRLLRKRPGAKTIAKERIDVTMTPDQVTAWAKTSKYLDGRIQSDPSQKPGRKPDMSRAASEAMRALLQELWWKTYTLNKQPMARPRPPSY